MTTHFEPLHKLKAHTNIILKCLISPDCQQLATTSADKTGVPPSCRLRIRASCLVQRPPRMQLSWT